MAAPRQDAGASKDKGERLDTGYWFLDACRSKAEILDGGWLQDKGGEAPSMKLG